MITVQIDEDYVIELLVNRVKNWTDDEDTIELFEQYYDNMVYNGCYNGSTLDVMSIVDNDYINNTSIITCEDYTKDRNEYLRDEIREFIKEEKDTYEDEEDFKEALKDKIEDLKENEAPEFDELERGEIHLNFTDYNYIEAKTDNSLLVTY